MTPELIKNELNNTNIRRVDITKEISKTEYEILITYRDGLTQKRIFKTN